MKRLSAALAAMLLAAPAQATTLTSIFDSFFVLGDSLSDNGNTATMAGRLAAQPENAPNVNFRPPRFAQQPGVSSDGPTWATGFVSEFQDAGKTAANLSFGAAWAANNGEGPPDLADQINGAAGFDTTFSFYEGDTDAFTISGTVPKYPDFGGGLASRIGGSDDRALVTVFIGGNDFLGTVPQIENDPTAAPEILNATVASTFGAVTTNSERLFNDLGVRDFIFMNLPDFSVIPFFNDPTDVGAFTLGQGISAAAQAYNELLFGTDTAPGYIDSLRARGARVTEIDIFALLSDQDAIAAAGNNIDTVNACVDVALAGNLVDCSNFLFWDGIHPTSVGHSIIAQATRDALDETYMQPVPLPAPAFMLVTALAGMAAVRRRRKAA